LLRLKDFKKKEVKNNQLHLIMARANQSSAKKGVVVFFLVRTGGDIGVGERLEFPEREE